MQLSFSKKKEYLEYLKIVVVFIPALVFFLNVWKYAVNVPSSDDYIAILDFLNKYKFANGIEKISLLLSQHNEHRILSSRLVYVIYYSLFNTINFRHLIFIGDIQLVIVFIVLLIFIKRSTPRYWFIASLFAGISLFDICGWENFDFAMGSMQNYGIFLWTCLGIFCYSKSPKVWLVPAVLFQIFCIYSSGNGIVAAAAILFCNVFSGNKTKALLSLIVFLIFTPLYFLHYTTPSTGHPATEAIKIIVYFFSMTGAIFSFDNNTQLLVAGITILTISLFVLPINKKFRIEPTTLPLVGLAFFILASTLLTAVFRCNFAIPNPSRYQIYPHFFITLVFIFFLKKMENGRFTRLIAILVIVANAVAYNGNYKYGKQNLARLQNSLSSEEFVYPDRATAKAVTAQSCNLKIYCIDNFRQSKK